MISQDIIINRCKEKGWNFVSNYKSVNDFAKFICPGCQSVVNIKVGEILYSNQKSCGLCAHKKGNKRKDITGLQVGMLEVIELDKYNGSNSSTWKCLCKKCNKVCIKKYKHLTYSKPIACPDCSKFIGGSKRNRSIGDITSKIYGHIKSGAKDRNLDFLISKEDIWNQYIKQSKKCFYTNTDITFSNNASLDRIDSKKGYIKDNIVICHKIINHMKNDFTIYEFIHLCQLIINPIIIENINYNIITKRSKHWYGVGNVGMVYFNSLVKNANKRKIQVNIKLEDIWNLYLEQKGICKLSGLPISFPDYKPYRWTASVDRINYKLPYDKSNIQLIHSDINYLKYTLNNEELRFWCDLIIKNKDNINGSSGMFTN